MSPLPHRDAGDSRIAGHDATDVTFATTVSGTV
jgi:hypothetical protein